MALVEEMSVQPGSNMRTVLQAGASAAMPGPAKRRPTRAAAETCLLIIKFPYGFGLSRIMLWRTEGYISALGKMELDIEQDLQSFCFYHSNKES